MADDGLVIADTYACDATGAPVQLITIVDGGHAWPGAAMRGPGPGGSAPSQRLNASDVIWAFFTGR